LPSGLAWRFVHIGGGDEAASLQALAQSLGLASRIEWQGAKTQEFVLARYREADLFVLASRIAGDGDRDGLPNVLVEAASQGLACISTSISGIPELFTDGENALLVEPEDPAALADALNRAIRDPALRERLGAAAERRVRADFDHHRSIEQLSRLFGRRAA
jgi:glycosyltransferase involved in cell wall biosynthesis